MRHATRHHTTPHHITRLRLPTAEAFSEAASALGLENQDHIVVYTTQKCFSAARCWWTFRVFGHEKVRRSTLQHKTGRRHPHHQTIQTISHVMNDTPTQVYILEGGLPAWKEAGGETESGEPNVTPSRPPQGLVEQG